MSAFAPDLSVIRILAQVLPGALPTAVNGIRVAASVRPRKFVIEGGDESPVTMPRTAFQVGYPDCTVMIDSGLDQATHDSFASDGKSEPYYPENFAKLRQALNRARLIVLTHFHADHVGGVVTAPNARELARKTIVSIETAKYMVTAPHRPHLKLDEEQMREFIVLDYAQYYPVAAGVVLVKAPGHSPDHQMVFVRLASGRELLHSVDTAWVLDNILQVKGKAAPWVKEDVPAVLGQLAWLNEVHAKEKQLTLLVTHDDVLFERVTQSGAIGALAV
jgi:glyoxylase-like metal-dependent hydrolase (beta-lactamase superfamily II)